MTTIRASGAAAALAAVVLSGCSESPSSNPAQQASAPEPKPVAPAKEVLLELPAPPANSQEVLVTVNGVPVTRGEINKVIDQQLADRLGPQVAMVPPDQIEGFKAQMVPSATEAAVKRTLLGLAAKAEGFVSTEQDVQKKIEELKGRLPQQITFEQALAQMGTSEADLRKNLSEELPIEALLKKHLDVAQPTEVEIKEFYESNKDKFMNPDDQVTARHILIKVAPTDDETAKTKAKALAVDVREQLVKSKGENFAALAAEHSACPSGKLTGGSLGSFSKGKMEETFETAAFSQKAGDIGPLVETKHGIHIIQVEKHDAAGTIPLDDIKDKIAEHLLEDKQSRAFNTYLEGLMKDAKIVYPEKEASKAPAAG